GVIGVCDSIVTFERTRGSGMMVLPVAAATASMTWPISASLKLGVMRWPLFLLCAPTMLVAVKASIATSSAARKEDCLITFNGFMYGFFLFVPGSRFGSALILVGGDSAITAVAAIAELFGFAGDLGHVEHQLLLSAIAGDAHPRVGRGIQRGEDFLRAV